MKSLEKIVIPFDEAKQLYNNLENHLSDIDLLVDKLKEIKISTFGGGFFYKPADLGVLNVDGASIPVQVDSRYIKKIKPADYQEYYGNATYAVLLKLYQAMVYIDSNYTELFPVTPENMYTYRDFQKRISGISVIIEPKIDNKIPPHLNLINHLSAVRRNLKQNLEDIFSAYFHHVENIREMN